MEVRDMAYADWKKGMKYKEIAEKYDVSESAVKSWASRHWKKKKVATKDENGCNQKRNRGAPLGSKNAKGNKGGGAPLGNQNNLKHGAFAKVYFKQLSDEELELLEDICVDEESQLSDQLLLLTIRERRMLSKIKEFQDEAKKGQVLKSVSSLKSKGYYGTIDGVPGDGKNQKKGNIFESTTTETESVSKYISTLEAELTKIQRAKTQAVKALADYHINKERLELEKDKRDEELEDLSDIEEDIYG